MACVADHFQASCAVSVAALAATCARKTLDALYPPTCVSCGDDGAWWCVRCREAILLFTHASDAPAPLSSLIVCGPYGHPALRLCITRLKYQSAACVEKDVEAWLKSFRGNYCEAWPWANRARCTVTSIPGDPRRLRERGRDHAADLARLVHDTFIPWADRRPLLARKRASQPNAQLPADATRTANVAGAFEALAPMTDPVLLVDDVFTTGATILEAARVLLAAGAPEVHAFTLAKG